MMGYVDDLTQVTSPRNVLGFYRTLDADRLVALTWTLVIEAVGCIQNNTLATPQCLW